MVRINLLGDHVDNTKANALQILAFGASLAVSIITCVLFQMRAVQEVSLLRTEKVALESELANLKKVTQEVADLEKKKRTLQERIVTISNLKAKKHGPVHTLDDLNLALPERSWVTGIKEKSGSLEISGVALDDQTVASFMEKLGQSKYFGNIELIQSAQHIVEGVKLKQFSVMAEMKNPFVRELPKPTKSVLPMPTVAAPAPGATPGTTPGTAVKKKLDI